MKERDRYVSYWGDVWRQFRKRPLPSLALLVVFLFVLVAIYAPLLASSKPIAVRWDGTWYFPLFRYLFYPRFFTKGIDLFFNLMMFTFPAYLIAWFFLRKKPRQQGAAFLGFVLVQLLGFLLIELFPMRDPAFDPVRREAYHKALAEERVRTLIALPFLPYVPSYSWKKELEGMSPYAELNLLLQDHLEKEQNEHWSKRALLYGQEQEQRWVQRQLSEQRRRLFREGTPFAQQPSDEELQRTLLESLSEEQLEKFQEIPTPRVRAKKNLERLITQYSASLESLKAEYPQAKKVVSFIQKTCYQDPYNFRCDYLMFLPPEVKNLIEKDFILVNRYEGTEARKSYLEDRENWIKEQNAQLSVIIYPLIRPFHWEDDAGGGEALNRLAPWWELTRINGKDLTAALIFGTRISLLVGVTAVGLALLIGIPLGAVGGFFGGKTDILIYRLIEIWESMPVFFMLLLVVGIVQTKSIFIIISVIGFFGWTGFSRYIRAEFFKQRNLPYVEACHMQGFSRGHVMFSHILPNALPPVLTLLPFAVMAAITSEAGLSFLGLGEEGSASWGVLMDEGRTAFPGESYLLWPPAILLTTLLIAIAIVGDGLRDALDPKLRR